MPLVASHCRGQEVIAYIDPAPYATVNLAGVNRTQSDHPVQSGVGGVMLIKGMTYKALTSQPRRLYSQLKKETKAHKLPVRYSHIETARYEKLMNLLNVFSEQVAAKAAKNGGVKRKGEWRGMMFIHL
jgi:heterodisulfide reductase subunit A